MEIAKLLAESTPKLEFGKEKLIDTFLEANRINSSVNDKQSDQYYIDIQ